MPGQYLFTERHNSSSHKANVCKPKCIFPIQWHDDTSEENKNKNQKQNKPLIFKVVQKAVKSLIGELTLHTKM